MRPEPLFLGTLLLLGITSWIGAPHASAQDNDKSGPVTSPAKAFKPPSASANRVHFVGTTMAPNSTSITGTDLSLNLQGFDLRSLIARIASIDPVRIDLPASIDPAARYDVSLALPTPSTDAAMNALVLQAVQDHFHLTASRVTRPTDVYVVYAIADPPPSTHAAPTPPDDDNVETNGSVRYRVVTASGENPSTARVGIDAIDGVSIPYATLDQFCQMLESGLDRPVVNETGLQGKFNFSLSSTSTVQNDLLAQLRSEMNLVIQPSSRAVEFLVFQPQGGASPQSAQSLLRRRSGRKTASPNWSSWLSASCQIEPGLLPTPVCARSNPPDRTPGPSGQAQKHPASPRSAP